MTDPVLSRCIVVPIDLHAVNRHALQILVHIARQLDRNLLGLLLEDIRLQQIADLPFTTEITLNSGLERRLLRDHLSQHQTRISTEIRRQLHELAATNQVELRFENAAGARWSAVWERDGNQDIFLPARKRWNTLLPTHPIKTNLVKRLGVVLANDVTDASIISVAGSLARTNLVGDIYVLSKQTPPPEKLHNLYHRGHQVRLHTNFSCTASEMLALISRSPYDLLILPGQCLQNIPGADLETALDEASGEVLLIN